MPTLIRLLVSLAVLAGLIYAGLWWLANRVEPDTREITITVPADRIGK